MPFTFGFFHDSALTTPVTALNPLVAEQDTDGSLPDTDEIIYFGSTATGYRVRDAVNPGVDPIEISVVDANAGTGSPATEFKLALSLVGLDSAVAGAALEIGTQVTSGTANAIPIYTRRTTAIAVAGVYTDLTLQTQQLAETVV